MRAGKPLIWLHGEVKSPPFSREGRLEAGDLLRRVQDGGMLGMPHSRPMPFIGPRCYELRVTDVGGEWRLVYRVDTDAVLIVEVFRKKTQTTPGAVIAACRRRLRSYDDE
ncbi:MAG: type II toxin-antitoxin system RelE/ParE family toxin [Elusimicrobiota bacterium]|nr:MAG: type II toxin-antitoxin system RelE/ParE family toxin [Elusimicrobiota bacterium]